jgi:hypothetical protein
MTSQNKQSIIDQCLRLLAAYESGDIGDTTMPEDTSPGFGPDGQEGRLSYFTLPMALNYQRNSYALWEAALKTWNDPETHDVFDVTKAAEMSTDELRQKLVKYKVALQPNKHVATWQRLSQIFSSEWRSIGGLFAAADNDYLQLKAIIQGTHKGQFPYLSGPKIFNYWSFIISTYGGVELKNRQHIGVAPDTHITKGSVQLGVITAAEAASLSKEEIAERWLQLLDGSGIDPIDMHPPLWFWSKNDFQYRP